MKIILDYDSYWNDIHKKNLSSFYESYEKGMAGSSLYYFLKLTKSIQAQVILAEDYLEKREFSHEDVIISERRTRNTAELLRTGACPLIVLTGEPPNADWSFYSHLYANTKPYKHAFLFSGSRKYIPKNVTFHPIYWPNNERSEATIERSLANANKHLRKKLVMVSGNNKQAYALFIRNRYTPRSIVRSIRPIIRRIRTKLIPSMKFVDLFPFRMEAIVHFSHKDYFDLYGRNWDNHKFLTKEESEGVKRLNPKEIDDKDLVVSQYQFALCFENTIYPGYVTEKIFDCFLSQCIPVYYGAPNIDEYVPANTFIDMRNFKDFKELEIFLENISEEKIDEYLFNINQFLKSDGFLKFADPYYANELFQIVRSHLLAID